MSVQTKIIRWLIALLWQHYRFLVMDIVVPPGKHLHANPYTVKPRGKE